MTRPLVAATLLAGAAQSLGAQAPEYSIQALRYATVPEFPLSVLVADAPQDERTDLALIIWLIRDGDRSILLDAGFHREGWFERFDINDYLRPDSAVRLAGLEPSDVTDIIISHAHWDHMGGIDLFPAATIWIQREEYSYYTGTAWQDGGLNGGIDPDDIMNLVRFNMEGRVKLIDGDGVEILPGIRVYTGARHTYASQYVGVSGAETYVLASDNCYLWLNLEMHSPVATFTRQDREANLTALDRMLSLAGTPDRIIPGHDLLQFERFPTRGRIARIK